MFKRLKAYLYKTSFQPDWLTLFYHPSYLRRRLLFRAIKQVSPQLQGKLLDFGCGRKPYRTLFAHNTQYIGVDKRQSGHDHTNSQIDVFYEDTLPFDNDSFEALLCIEVMEHVFEPNDTLKELNRVLKVGGKALFTTPFVCNEHEVPYDYARYTSYGWQHLAKKHGFRIVVQHKIGNFANTLAYLMLLYPFAWANRYLSNYVLYVLLSPFTTLYNLLGLFFGWLLPKEQSLYLNYLVLLQKDEIA